MSFIRTGLREIGLKIRRQRTRMILRHEKRLLQKSEITLGREGTSQAANFPELRNEIVALKKLEQEQKEVTLRIAQIEEGIKKIEEQRGANSKEQANAIATLETEMFCSVIDLRIPGKSPGCDSPSDMTTMCFAIASTPSSCLSASTRPG